MPASPSPSQALEEAEGVRAGLVAARLDELNRLRVESARRGRTGVQGELEPVSKSGPWQTPHSAADIHRVRQALEPSGAKRERIVEDALERKLFNDLRLVSPALACLQNERGLRYRAAREGLLALGRAIVPELREALDPAGKTIDARRLWVISTLDAKEGLELCRLALRPGPDPKRRSPAGATWRGTTKVPVMAEAMAWLPQLAEPDEVERTALAFSHDGDFVLRSHALRALGQATGDEALERLVACVDHQASLEALIALGHPQTTPRLLRELEERTGRLSPTPPPDQHQITFPTVGGITHVLGKRKDGYRSRVADVLVELSRHPWIHIRSSAVMALRDLWSVNERVMPRLVEMLETGLDREHTYDHHAVVWALWEVPPAQREPAIPGLLRLIQKPGLHEQMYRDVVIALGCPGSRHRQAILDALCYVFRRSYPGGSDTFGARDWAFRSLGQLGMEARPALPVALEHLQRQPWDSFHEEEKAVQVLPSIDPEGTEAIPALIAMLGHRQRTQRHIALKMLAAYGPKASAAIPAVTGLLQSDDYFTPDRARQTLAAIQPAPSGGT
jgi:hypothetical protein